MTSFYLTTKTATQTKRGSSIAVASKTTIIAAIILVAFTILAIQNLHTTTNTSTRSHNTTTNRIDSKYKLAVTLLKKVLDEARRLYPDITRKYMEFNLTIINETTLILNNTVYKYVIASIYDADNGISLDFSNLSIDGVKIKYIPTNKTYTGMRPINYLIQTHNKTCKATFWTITYVEASRNITVQDTKACNGIYTIRYTIARKLGNTGDITTIRIILIKDK